MRSRLGLLLIALLVFLVGACARTSPYVDEAGTPLIDPQLEAKPTEATLCIYRPFKFGSGLASPLILIDGETAVLLHNAGYTQIQQIVGAATDAFRTEIIDAKRHTGVLTEGLRHELQLVAEGFQMHLYRRHADDRAHLDERFRQTRLQASLLHA